MTRRGQKAFTLFELLVATFVAIILIAMVYTVYSRAALGYRVQNLTLEMQAQARFGLEHLRRDLANAGFNGTTNSAVDLNLCTVPATPLRAFVLKRKGNDANVANPGVNINIAPMSVTLFGDYSGDGNVFYTQSIVGATVTLQSDFKGAVTQAEFEDMFLTGNRRYLRVVDKEQYEMLETVSSANYDLGTITLSSALPVKTGNQACGVQGFGEGLEVNSAHFVRYRIARDDRTGAAPGKTDLIREEVMNDGKTPAPGTQLIIAENAIDLGFYDFVFDSDTTGTAPAVQMVPTATDVIIDEGGGGWLGGSGTAPRTQDLRFVTVKLTVRSTDEDLDLVHKARQSETGPIYTFDVAKDLEGAAHTLTMTSKVMLSTLAVRNVKAGSS